MADAWTAGHRAPLIGACLSLTGRYARFGRQAAAGLEAWRELSSDAEVRIEDDCSDPGRLPEGFRRLAAVCDLHLGPYSTILMRAAVQAASEIGCLLWNHGGAGDDVQALSPGRIVSVLTPASRYAEPFLRHLAGREPLAPLWIVAGRGRFGQQVAAGAQALAHRLGLRSAAQSRGALPSSDAPGTWDLLCAGSFEEDVETVIRARALAAPPRTICAVAAGVQAFGTEVANPEGVYGVAQWFPGRAGVPDLGPAEADFLAAYAALTGGRPDYPAVQAAAAALLASHCAQVARSVEPGALWSVAAGLDVDTFFGRFKIDPATGVQSGHETVLLRWTPEGLAAVR